DADFGERVMRRFKELVGRGSRSTLQEVAEDLRNRDTIDSTRQHSPLKKAEDAIYLDTTRMSIEEVADKVVSYING
ncbi:MAG: (d)CMP kinase, partial [Deltaproteobacteria bacterium]